MLGLKKGRYGADMSVVTVYSACLDKGRVVEVAVEVDIQPGLPVFAIIGLPDKGVEEAKERVRAALRNSGFQLPLGRITVNLSPSSLRKHGAGFDLAIALALLLRMQRIPSLPRNTWIMGELSLNGSVKSLQHIAPLLIEAKKKEIAVVVPPDQIEVAAMVGGLHSASPPSLTACIGALSFKQMGNKERVPTTLKEKYLIDDIYGQDTVKRAMLIALAGKHTLLFTGPAGCGKTMLAGAASELLPPLNHEEILELGTLHAYAGRAFSYKASQRPYIHPHHQVTQFALFGGGAWLRPGDITLAHGGLLFLDEFAEMRPQVRELLRQPMQEKEIRFSVPGHTVRYPVATMIWAAQNTCPCGLLGVEGEVCRCTPGELVRYRRSLSEPLLERFSLHVEVSKVFHTLEVQENQLKGKAMAASIARVWEKHTCKGWKAESTELLEKATRQLRLSPRVQTVVRSVAETIAVVDEVEMVSLENVQEALQYRCRPATLLNP